MQRFVRKAAWRLCVAIVIVCEFILVLHAAAARLLARPVRQAESVPEPVRIGKPFARGHARLARPMMTTWRQVTVRGTARGKLRKRIQNTRPATRLRVAHPHRRHPVSRKS